MITILLLTGSLNELLRWCCGKFDASSFSVVKVGEGSDRWRRTRRCPLKSPPPAPPEALSSLSLPSPSSPPPPPPTPLMGGTCRWLPLPRRGPEAEASVEVVALLAIVGVLGASSRWPSSCSGIVSWRQHWLELEPFRESEIRWEEEEAEELGTSSSSLDDRCCCCGFCWAKVTEGEGERRSRRSDGF